MLRHLRVTNFALLSDVTIEFEGGFNALTGETGAGKSLIVEAVNLLRGGRASANIPRAGANSATVEAIFEVPADIAARVQQILAAAGLPSSAGDDDAGADDADGVGADDDAAADPPNTIDTIEVLVRRVIQRGGRSRTYVNGALTTAKRLGELGAWLVDLSGQHQHQGLVDAKRHREILDAFAGNARERQAMSDAYERLAAAQEAIDALSGPGDAMGDKLDYLRFQLEELDSAQVEVGEDDALEGERNRLQALDRLLAGARQAEEALYAGEPAAVDLLSTAHRHIDKLSAIDPALEEWTKQIEEARVLAEEAASGLGRYADGLDGDPETLAHVEDRLALLNRLKRKHGGSLATVVQKTEQLRRELEDLEHRDERLAELEAERDRAEKAARRAADALSRTRNQAGATVCTAVEAYLAELGMAAAVLSVRIEGKALTVDGHDRVEFLLASNKGEEAKPLVRIASGGELSRIMLALKLSLRKADEVATYVFDEVDTGVGGATAEVVGRQIRALGDQRQVLCVTHLPQIAAYADRHLHVSKYEVADRTETTVRLLGGRERREEMARMLGGMEVTASARAHADAMLKSASRGGGRRGGRSRPRP